MSKESSTPKFLTQGMGRRKFLKNSAFAIAGTTSLAAFLAACGDNTATTAVNTSASCVATTDAGVITAIAGASGSTATAGNSLATTAAAVNGPPVTLSYQISDSQTTKDIANAY